MNFEEYKVQEAIFKHHQIAFPYVKFVFIPNASADAKTGYFNKQMGLHPGAFDIHLFWNRFSIDAKPSYIRVGIYEVKSSTGVISSSQNKYGSEMHSMGAYHGYGSKVSSYHQTLCKWGLKPLSDGVREADTRTWGDKKKDAFNLYAPPGKRKP